MLTVENERAMELSLLEEFQGGPSYTVDLLRQYKQRHDNELYLILGADSVGDLLGWKEPESIAKLATLVIFPRTGYSPKVPVNGDVAVVLFEEPVIDVSSTEIRRRCREGRSVEAMLTEAVHSFILDNALYS